ncbi:hypothetical protein I7I51_04142 [Histoplasma capsulatum]|uniref:Uncharacterized protein n=1 Tax=Ajellomyces capsulatus TaxID=5037 RepID=A0A8A1M8A2_AJECA|nr:hypothetical protein I7I51_04142 [Histoplasma capsulatum]
MVSIFQRKLRFPFSSAVFRICMTRASGNTPQTPSVKHLEWGCSFESDSLSLAFSIETTNNYLGASNAIICQYSFDLSSFPPKNIRYVSREQLVTDYREAETENQGFEIFAPKFSVRRLKTMRRRHRSAKVVS